MLASAPSLNSQPGRLGGILYFPSILVILLFWLLENILLTFLNIHNPDGIGAKVLVLPTATVVLHLQQNSMYFQEGSCQNKNGDSFKGGIIEDKLMLVKNSLGEVDKWMSG